MSLLRLAALATTALATSALLTPQATAASFLSPAVPTLKVGAWTVLRTDGGASGKVECHGAIASNYGTQLQADGLHVRLPAEPQSLTLQFGDQPAQATRPPKMFEKVLREAVLDGEELAQVLKTERLRLRYTSAKRGSESEDLDLRGIAVVAEQLRLGCPSAAVPQVPALPTLPVSAGASGAAPAAPAAAGAAPAADACSDALVARLRAAGVTYQQIAAACRN